jgi:hypothetical protein
MTWLATGIAAGASMLISGMQQSQQSVNAARNLTKQNKAKMDMMEDQFMLSTQNMHNNEQLINRQKMKNDVAIQENKLEAMDLFAQAFAGSGVSGRTVDVLDAEISRGVSEAHNENQSMSDQQKDNQFIGLMREGQANQAAIKNLNLFDAGAAEANQNMAILASGVSTFSSAANNGRFDKPLKKYLK